MNHGSDIILRGLRVCMAVLIVSSFSFVDSYSFERHPLTERFNIYNGLSDDTVNDILCDSRGFIWVATCKGLDRYDGYNFRHITMNDPRLLYEDTDGSILVETPDGMYRLDALNNQLAQIELRIPSSSGTIFSISPDWRLFRTDSSDGKTSPVPEVRGMKVYDVLVRENGEIWCATPDGVTVFDVNFNEIGHYTAGLGSTDILPESVRVLAEDYLGGVWCGTYYSGIVHIVANPASLRISFPETQDVNFRPRNMAFDPDGGFLWLTSLGSGFYRFYPSDGRFEKIPLPEESRMNTQLGTMYLDGDRLWLGNRNHVCVIDRKTFRVLDCLMVPGGVQAFFRDRDGGFWISCGNSLNYSSSGGRYDGDSGAFEGNHGILGSFGNFHEIVPHACSSIIQDREGRIWASSFVHGIMKWDRTAPTYYNRQNGRSCSYKVSSLVQSADGRIWAGTYGDGLLCLSEGDDCFVKASGIVGRLTEPIFSIVADGDGMLWLTTSESLILFDPATGRSMEYGWKDGLDPLSFNYAAGIMGGDGRIYAGMKDRIVSFIPSAFRNSCPKSLRMSLTDFRILDGKGSGTDSGNIVTSDRIELPYGCNSFEMNVSDMNYGMPRNSALHYRLEGMSSEWIPVREGKLSFISLPVGNYRLMIASADNGGKFRPETREIRFRVRPPFMLSAGMIVLYVILLVLIVGLIILAFRRKALRDAESRAMTESLVRESENEKKLYASKVEFISNIAHEIKTPLSLIKLPAESLARRFHNFSDKSVIEDVEIINRNSAKLDSLLDELLNIREFDSINYEMNPEDSNVCFLVSAVFRRFEISARKKGLRFTSEVPDTPMNTFLDRMHFDKILTNLMSNALKYSSRDVRLSLTEADGNFIVVVENDGTIVPLEMREKIFYPLVRYEDGNLNVPGTGLGLSISRKLAVLMGGSLAMDDATDRNRFVLKLPLRKSVSEPEAEDCGKKKDAPNLSGEGMSRILIVEDNDEMADYIVKKLSPQFIALAVPDGKKALECIEMEGVPSVIITDLVMPGMDGFSFCREVKKNRRLANIPILVISAMPEGEARILSLEFGADAFIGKPFTYELLETTIRGLIRNRERVSNHYSAYPVSDAAGKTGGPDGKLLARIQEYVIENISDPSIRVNNLAEAACMSKSNLLKKMKSMLDMTPGEFILAVRLRKAQELLADPSYPISEIASSVGFASSSYFSQAFTRMYGMTPRKFRECVKSA